MKGLKILIIIAVLILIFVLQKERFFTFNSINPNLWLIFFSVLIFNREKTPFLFSLLLITMLMAFFWLPFWFWKVWLIIGLVLFFYLFRNYLTGNQFFDFLITLIASTIIFYLVVSFNTAVIAIILKEIIYNIILGTFIYLLVAKKTGEKYSLPPHQ